MLKLLTSVIEHLVYFELHSVYHLGLSQICFLTL